MRARSALLLLLLALVAACGGPPRAEPAPPRVELAPALVAATPEPPSEGEAARSAPPPVAPQAEPGTYLPVGPADPTWGSAVAPVTFVVFGDYQCPFTRRHVANLEELERRYGPEVLRVVWKDNPLPFHPRATPAAVAAETVFRLGGPSAFWRFHHLLFENQKTLEDADLARFAQLAGVEPTSFRGAYERGAFAASIEEDLGEGRRVGVTGTPMSFINGTFLSGAQPLEKLVEVIESAREEARVALRDGTPPGRLYATLADRNGRERPVPAPSAAAPSAPRPPSIRDDGSLVWSVPIQGSPAKGGKAPLVTLVVFSDFQCPFCGRVKPTLDALGTQYGDDLRLVWKDQPLPFHLRAEPAAELAREARAQKGEGAFWGAVDLLFANQQRLEDPDLEGYARALGLDVPRAMKAVVTKRHQAPIEGDLALAEDLLASGTPHFFVNGRRLAGAQPKERFVALIDEELAKAAKLVAGGVPRARVYDELQKGARKSAPLDRIVLPKPTARNPGKGAKSGAKVVIQMFADFQCPFCKRTQPVLDEVIAAYPGKVRVVFRHLPLSIHADAPLAAEAAMEAFRQKGDAGFWAMSELLFTSQGGAGLARPELDAAARQLGLDLSAWSAALESHAHRAAVEADSRLAADVGVTGTPAFAINDYYLSGTQPLSKWKRLVDKALGPAEPIDPAARVYRLAPPP